MWRRILTARNIESSPEQKRKARRAFEAPRVETLARTLAEFKQRAKEADAGRDVGG
jgi:hypothetical protein